MPDPVTMTTTQVGDPTSAVAPIAAPKEGETPTPPVETPKRETASQLVAALAKEKKQRLNAHREAQTAKDQITRLQAQLDELQSKYVSKPQSPAEALTRYGYSYDDAVTHQLNGGRVTPEMEVKSIREELQAYKKEQEESAKHAQEQANSKAQKQYEDAISQFKVELGEFIDANAETYDLIKFNEAEHMVFETIEEHYKKQNKVLSNKEAADLVELFLEEREIEKFEKSKKLKARYAPIQADTKQVGVPSTSSKTLSNATNVSSSAPSMLPAKTEQDRLRRAMEKLDGR